jgi:hypothetical protein
VDLDTVAAGQYGLVTSAQLSELGVPPSTVRNWRHRKRLERVQPGVNRLAGTTQTFHQKLLAAVLSAGSGAAASHRAAARLWDMWLPEPDQPPEIVVPRDHRVRLWNGIAHSTRDPIPTVRRHGIPTTTPMRTLVDLGAVCNAHEVEDALDRALIGRLCTVAAVEWELARVARTGRRGAGVLHQVLDDRALGAQRPDGLLEPRFARLVRRFGLPQPVFQYRFGRFRIDFAWPRFKVAVEVDGYQFHGSRAAWQADRARQNVLGAAGWVVLRFTWEELVRRPGAVAAAILAAMAV